MILFFQVEYLASAYQRWQEYPTLGGDHRYVMYEGYTPKATWFSDSSSECRGQPSLGYVTCTSVVTLI